MRVPLALVGGLVAPLVLAALTLGAGGCDAVTPDEGEDPRLAGGATTVFGATTAAFSTPAPNLTPEELARFRAGDAAFEASFVTAPAPVNPGLGPVFNQTSCIACHAGDGRSRASLLLRLSAGGRGPNGEPVSVPGFGTQLQDRALVGYVPEGRIEVTWTERTLTLADGTPVALRVPAYRVVDGYRALPADVEVSPRFSRPVFGLGLLEAVPEAAVLALAAEQAARGAVSGRPNYVWDAVEDRVRLGRFGWKANQPSLLHQSATAYAEDMGITSPYHPAENAAGQPEHGDGQPDDPENTAATVEAVTFYTRTLGVPARRGLDDPEVRRGERLFAEVGCASCHVPRLRTGGQPDLPAVAHQTIFPYTDLLLHDMGAELADGRPDFEADGREWRTPPLWGLGLAELVNGHLELMHDGRARGVVEAVLWHGGEAEASRERFRRLTTAERDALLAFIHSL
jgi:CxxC motif-containing protein (DUF1111 family)